VPEQLLSLQRYIAIEGPIGVGKSSLAKRIAGTVGSSLLLEKPAENPFLDRFYKSPRRYALPAQLFFLFQRVRQMQDIKQRDMFTPGRVADFILEKDPLFAQVTLNDDEFRLYQQVFNNLQIDRLQPDIVIYLQAPVDVLQQRIKKRRNRNEKNIEPAYLKKLCDAYTTFFHRYSSSPLLIVNAAEFNPIDNDQHYHALLNQIARIEAGKHFFNPLAQ
jgi:deoxyadenosine/deoxycytidine kinase